MQWEESREEGDWGCDMPTTVLGWSGFAWRPFQRRRRSHQRPENPRRDFRGPHQAQKLNRQSCVWQKTLIQCAARGDLRHQVPRSETGVLRHAYGWRLSDRPSSMFRTFRDRRGTCGMGRQNQSAIASSCQTVCHPTIPQACLPRRSSLAETGCSWQPRRWR